MTHIFLSYAREDVRFMQRLRDSLHTRGFDVWVDETGLEPGTPNWEEAIEKAIRDANCMVVVLSPDARESRWVRSEIDYAESLGLRLFPVLARGDERSSVPLRLRLTQRVDAINNFQGALQELADALSEHLSGESVQSRPARPTFTLPMLEWIEIARGSVILDTGQMFQVEPFKMSKYPVTYAQFQGFTDASDGYGDDLWWEGLAKRESRPDTQTWEIDNHPREDVSWYDAVAFSRWLGSKLGQLVRLPTEWEWQWAAQGPDGRNYPWGSAFDSNKCNTREAIHGSGFRKSTPVDQYPDGASWVGVMDLCGNVWEWCLNEYENPEKTDFEGAAPRALRGGSRFTPGADAHVARRFSRSPSKRTNYIGFRVVAVMAALPE